MRNSNILYKYIHINPSLKFKYKSIIILTLIKYVPLIIITGRLKAIIFARVGFGPKASSAYVMLRLAEL